MKEKINTKLFFSGTGCFERNSVGVKKLVHIWSLGKDYKVSFKILLADLSIICNIQWSGAPRRKHGRLKACCQGNPCLKLT